MFTTFLSFAKCFPFLFQWGVLLSYWLKSILIFWPTWLLEKVQKWCSRMALLTRKLHLCFSLFLLDKFVLPCVGLCTSFSHSSGSHFGFSKKISVGFSWRFQLAVF